jgi:hypothetical protein
MTERPNTIEHDGDGESALEWRLPASLATKSAIELAIEDHAPASKVALERQFETAPDQYVVLLNRGKDEPKNISLFRSDVFATGADGVTQRGVDRTEYEYQGGEDPTLLRTEWPTRKQKDEPAIISEGEAKSLLNTLYSLQHRG